MQTSTEEKTELMETRTDGINYCNSNIEANDVEKKEECIELGELQGNNREETLLRIDVKEEKRRGTKN